MYSFPKIFFTNFLEIIPYLQRVSKVYLLSNKCFQCCSSFYLNYKNRFHRTFRDFQIRYCRLKSPYFSLQNIQLLGKDLRRDKSSLSLANSTSHMTLKYIYKLLTFKFSNIKYHASIHTLFMFSSLSFYSNKTESHSNIIHILYSTLSPKTNDILINSLRNSTKVIFIYLIALSIIENNLNWVMFILRFVLPNSEIRPCMLLRRANHIGVTDSVRMDSTHELSFAFQVWRLLCSRTKYYKLVIDLVLAFVQSFGLSFGRCCIEDLRSEPIWSNSGLLWLEKARAKS